MSTDVTLLHNTRCSTSRAALETLENSGISFEVVHYLKEPLTAEQLRDLVALFPENFRELVRRDDNFGKLGLTDTDVQTPDQVIAVLTAHPQLLQRPIIIRHDSEGDRAIIGRPKDAVAPFLTS